MRVHRNAAPIRIETSADAEDLSGEFLSGQIHHLEVELRSFGDRSQITFVGIHVYMEMVQVDHFKQHRGRFHARIQEDADVVHAAFDRAAQHEPIGGGPFGKPVDINTQHAQLIGKRLLPRFQRNGFALRLLKGLARRGVAYHQGSLAFQIRAGAFQLRLGHQEFLLHAQELHVGKSDQRLALLHGAALLHQHIDHLRTDRAGDLRLAHRRGHDPSGKPHVAFHGSLLHGGGGDAERGDLLGIKLHDVRRVLFVRVIMWIGRRLIGALLGTSSDQQY